MYTDYSIIQKYMKPFQCLQIILFDRNMGNKISIYGLFHLVGKRKTI